eukprot:284035-Pyramimonas_sp.AAC.2
MHFASAYHNPSATTPSFQPPIADQPDRSDGPTPIHRAGAGENESTQPYGNHSANAACKYSVRIRRNYTVRSPHSPYSPTLADGDRLEQLLGLLAIRVADELPAGGTVGQADDAVVGGGVAVHRDL